MILQDFLLLTPIPGRCLCVEDYSETGRQRMSGTTLPLDSFDTATAPEQNTSLADARATFEPQDSVAVPVAPVAEGSVPSDASNGSEPSQSETLAGSATGDEPTSSKTGWDASVFRVRYWLQDETVKNFGDLLADFLGARLLTYPKVPAEAFHLIGSVIDVSNIAADLKDLRPGATIAYWCCGMRQEMPIDPYYLQHCAIFGVRGPQSRKLLGLPDDTPMGDPALLLPLLHKPETVDALVGKTLCIPHILDPLDDDALLALSGADVVARPGIASGDTGVVDMINKIASADFVLSGSLHGAIVAAAYGKPFAFWDTGYLDISFKWRDFASSIQVTCAFVRTIEQGRLVYDKLIAPSLRLPPLTPILEVCPFAVHPSALLRAISFDGLAGPGEFGSAIAALDSLVSLQPAALREAVTKTNAMNAALAKGV